MTRILAFVCAALIGCSQSSSTPTPGTVTAAVAPAPKKPAAPKKDSEKNLHVKGDEVWVEDAKILGAVSAVNGIVYVVDGVILPPAK